MSNKTKRAAKYFAALNVIKFADFLIDLGPEGGDAGGHIVAQGTPEEVSMVKASHTGRFLKEILKGGRIA